jgi:flagellar hook-associated protein 2
MSDTTAATVSASTSSALLSTYYQPAITFSGLGSGIDSQTMIDRLVEVESQQKARLESWKEEWTEKIAVLEALNTKMTDFRSSVAAMETPAEFQVKTATSSNTTVLSATASSTATSGSHQVLVNQLAQNDVWAHAGLASTSDVVNSSGAGRVFAFKYPSASSTSVSIAIPDGATLTDLATAINSSGANPGVTATVMDMGPSYTTDRYRLLLQGNDIGDDYNLSIDDALTTLDGTGGTVDFRSTTFLETQDGQNAQIRVDGYPPAGWIERANNTVSDLLSGVTLSLQSTSASAVQVTVNDDTGAVQDKIADLVENYNDVIAYIKEQTKYDETTGQAGILLGNYVLQIVKGKLNDLATSNASGFQSPEDDFINLPMIGITTDSDESSETFGQLLIDENTLTEALTADAQGVANLMSAYFQGVSDDTSGNITYHSYLPDITEPGIYAVQATVAGGVITSGTINGNPTIISGNT